MDSLLAQMTVEEREAWVFKFKDDPVMTDRRLRQAYAYVMGVDPHALSRETAIVSIAAQKGLKCQVCNDCMCDERRGAVAEIDISDFFTLSFTIAGVIQRWIDDASEFELVLPCPLLIKVDCKTKGEKYMGVLAEIEYVGFVGISWQDKPGEVGEGLLQLRVLIVSEVEGMEDERHLFEPAIRIEIPPYLSAASYVEENE